MALDSRLPSIAALAGFLAASNVAAPEGGFQDEDLEGAIVAAVGVAEELTGWTPLLTTVRAISIDPPPGGSRPGEWPVATVVKVRLPAPVAAVTSLGTSSSPVLVGTWSLAAPAGLDGPYTLLKLYARPFGPLTLTGTIGRWSTLPGAVRQALLRLAGEWFLSQRREGLLAEGLASWDDGGVKESRGYEMTTSIGEGFRAEAERDLATFARVQF